MVKYYCDACGKHLEQEDLEKSNELNKTHQSFGEIFCSRCIVAAPDYYESKTQLLREIAEENLRRLLNHRKEFFKKVK